MTEELLKEISAKLDRLTGVTAIQGKPEEKQAQILKSLGLTYKEMSQVMGVPEGTLKVRDHLARKKK